MRADNPCVEDLVRRNQTCAAVATVQTQAPPTTARPRRHQPRESAVHEPHPVEGQPAQEEAVPYQRCEVRCCLSWAFPDMHL